MGDLELTNNINYVRTIGSKLLDAYNYIETDLLLNIGHHPKLYSAEIRHYVMLETLGIKIVNLADKLENEIVLTADDIGCLTNLFLDSSKQLYAELEYLLDKSERSKQRYSDRHLTKKESVRKAVYFRRTSRVREIMKSVEEGPFPDHVLIHQSSYSQS